MSSDDRRPDSWTRKFGHAFRGLKEGVRGQGSFFVHCFAAVAVLAAAAALRLDRVQWCLLVLCIAVVLSAELFNSALEALAKAVTDQYHPRVRDALDIASAAVLTAAGGAAIVGALIFIGGLIAS